MTEEPVKVLYFVDRMLRGGIQSLVIDWVSRFDKQKLHVDFLLLDDGNKYELEEKLKELGCTVYKLEGMWIRQPFDFIRYRKKLNEFFKNHSDYKVVHLHSSSKNFQVLKYAKKYKIPIRIAHSHNMDFQTKNIAKKLVGNLFKKPLVKYSTDYFACSKLAGKWLLGEKIVNSNKFKLIHNAVDYKKFKFNNVDRLNIRNEYNIAKNEILFGNVSRFANQKNHTFLIDIFNEYLKINQNSKLILVGTGELEEIIKEKVNKLGISKNVIFTGFRSDVNRIMQAIDIFLLPSLHEGLPVVGIEAQASGVPVFTSKDVVTSELKIANNVQFISLDKSAKEWAQEISKFDISRNDNYEVLKENKYLIDDIVNELTNFYISI